jgi:hypothetical protein
LIGSSNNKDEVRNAYKIYPGIFLMSRLTRNTDIKGRILRRVVCYMFTHFTEEFAVFAIRASKTSE